MSDEQLDEELEDLLNDLGQADPLPKPSPEPKKVATLLEDLEAELPPGPSPAPEPPNVRGPLEEFAEPPELKEKPEEHEEESTAAINFRDDGPLDAQETADEILNIKEFVDRHRQDYTVARNNLRVDRGKIDTVIAVLLDKLQAGGAKGPEVESLVRALDVLAKTNDTQVRLMDSHSKLISSAKSTISTLIQQNFTGHEAKELQQILRQDVHPDEA